MPKPAVAAIEALFAHPARPGQPVDFAWRLIRRRRRPFLLLPQDAAGARAGMRLYSAQRRLARMGRAFLPWLLHTPAANFFERVQFRADASSDFMQFLARQAGVPAPEVFPTAIKLSETGTRLVLLLCDEGGRPARVIKVGIDAAGRKAADQEADLLEKFPPAMLGCARITGRLSAPGFSAFAMDYFPGGNPDTDAGMEHLFHAWLDAGDSIPLDRLPSWRELDAAIAQADLDHWRALKKMLAGKTVRPALCHGDFAPWNVRVVNSQNLQAFDWEHGCLQGIPGWDWFHFTVQTSILARRHSTERVAAEVEQLIHSARFKKYAAAAGISDIVQPLLLAYLLRQKWVFQPGEGGQTTAELFEFLSARWQLKPEPAPAATPPRPVEPRHGLWGGVRHQLKSAAAQWCNLFWEPRLNSTVRPSLLAQLQACWPDVLLAGLLLAAVAVAQYCSSPHLGFLPFYMAGCALATWKIDRRWGALAATVATLAGSLIAGFKDAAFGQVEVMLWNTVMRFLLLQMCVLFVDRIHMQKNFFRSHGPANEQPVRLAATWAVVFTSGLLFAATALMDCVTDPRLVFLPLYLLPCMVITLALNLRWGTAATLLAVTIRASVEYWSNNHHYTVAEVFGWNFLMRLAMSLLVIVLLDRIRRENILFFPKK